MAPNPRLLERESQLAQLDALLRAASEGDGAALLIEGEAGIGKTALLRAAESIALNLEFKVLTARGGELEREFPYGVARQLLERELAVASELALKKLFAGAAALAAPIVSRAVGGAATESSQPDAFAFQHGLYWLLSNLAEERPVALIIDDVQWADLPSLRFLNYLTRRLQGVPIAVIAAVRLGEESQSSLLVDQLRGEAIFGSVELGPLGERSVATLVGDLFGTDVDPEFSRACREVSGGNPFLLSELLQTLSAEGGVANGSSVERVREVGPAAVTRSVLLRLLRHSREAVALGQAVAVLGTGAELRHAAALAGLSATEASQAADDLTDARILVPGRPLDFLHPLIRTSIYADLPAGRLSSDHKRAAQLLAVEGAEFDRVAGHLLATDPTGDPWVVEQLRAAGTDALSRSSLDAAVRYLTRALAEPPSGSERPGVLATLGSAELLSGAGGVALEHLQEARELSRDPGERARLATAAVRELVPRARLVEAVRILNESIAETAGLDTELELMLQASLVTTLALLPDEETSRASLRRLEDRGRELRGETPAERLLLANLAYQRVRSNAPAEEVVALARRALGDGRLAGELAAPLPHAFATFALVLVDSFELAGREAQILVERAGAIGSVIMLSIGSMLHSWVALRCGALADAEAYGRTAVDRMPRERVMSFPATVSILVDVLVERGELDAAQAELDGQIFDEQTATFGFLLESRGRLRAARGDTDGALHDFLAAGEVNLKTGTINPAFGPWRSHAALALMQVGDVAEAGRLAQEELELARRFGAPRALAIALRARALTESGDAMIELLREAAVVLHGSPALLTKAQVFVELGAALRRANNRAASREPLSIGLDLADRCGARPLAERARDELRAAGARPRRVRRLGVEALTASERRTCQLAAEGLSNPEIAQALFITRATVESHLHSAYQKLGIAKRSELARSLEPAHA